jgi:hypothetical protein
MGRPQPLFGRGGAWSNTLSDAARSAAPSLGAFQVCNSNKHITAF